MQRMKGQGNPVPNGPKEQNYSNPMTSSMAAPTTDPYMSPFYMTSTPYQAFGVGDGTWSNAGEHMQTFLGGYGGQVGYDSHNAAIEGIFSGGNFGGFNAPAPANYNYGFHGNGDFSAWGGSDVRAGTKTYDEYYQQRNVTYQDDRVKGLEQSVQGLTLADNKATQDFPKDPNNSQLATNGAGCEKISAGGNSPNASDPTSKKSLSWSSVTSPPPRIPPVVVPPVARRKEKVHMPTIMSGRHLDIGTWEGKNGGNGKSTTPSATSRSSWDAPRGGTKSSAASPPYPSTQQARNQSQQPGGSQQSSSPQGQTKSPVAQSPLQSQQQASPQQISPPQQLPVGQQRHSPPSLLQGAQPIRDVSSGSPQSSSPYGPSAMAGAATANSPPQPTLEDLQVRNDYNPKEFEMAPQNARFFVIKSYSEDDIHRSIKYEIWCSTEHGNKRLDLAFRDAKGPILLFFSVNGSGHFCGMAQMASHVDYNASAGVWAQDKWKGQFRVKWIYVKDVPNPPLRHIRLENNENKSVTNSRDTQEVLYDKGLQVLKIIHNYRHNTSIFDDFIHYEKRQEESETRRHHPSPKEFDQDDMRAEQKDSRGGGGGGEYRSGGNDYRSPDSRTGEYRSHDFRGGGNGGGGGGGGGGDYRSNDYRGGANNYRDHPRDYYRDYHRGGWRGGRGGHQHGPRGGASGGRQ